MGQVDDPRPTAKGFRGLVRVVFSELADAGLRRLFPDDHMYNNLRQSIRWRLLRDPDGLEDGMNVADGISGRLMFILPHWNDIRILW